MKVSKMIGQSSATIEIRLVGPIHTFVSSSCGLAWGCFGRSENGSLLTSGPGSSSRADCLSKNNAGILYGITGVCHQAANRISFPAQLKAVGAGGYAQSVFTFGEYGRSFPGIKSWEAIKRECSARATSQISFDENISAGSRSTLSDSRYDHDERDHPMVHVSSDEETLRLVELSGLVERGIGRPLERVKFEELSRIQIRLRERQAEIARRLLLNEITKEEYLTLLDNDLAVASNESEALLGEEDFKRIFGEKADAQSLVDADEFLKQGPLSDRD